LADEEERNKTLRHDVGNINEICQQSKKIFALNKKCFSKIPPIVIMIV
jgi:hypothetical protein